MPDGAALPCALDRGGGCEVGEDGPAGFRGLGNNGGAPPFSLSLQLCRGQWPRWTHIHWPSGRVLGLGLHLPTERTLVVRVDSKKPRGLLTGLCAEQSKKCGLGLGLGLGAVCLPGFARSRVRNADLCLAMVVQDAGYICHEFSHQFLWKRQHC